MEKTFAFDYRKAEAAGATRALREASAASRRGRLLAINATPAVLVFLFCLASYVFGWWGEWLLTVSIIACMVGLGVTRLVSPWLRRKWAAPPARASLDGRRIAYAFEDTGYRISTEFFEGFQKWGGVERLVDGAEAILFVVGDHAHFLPHRLFASEAERRGFLAWALDRLMPEARARSRIGEISSSS